ncbi:MAG TPA: CopG family transcriptional regulator [Thermoanaerobaculia bacterium]|nr:CopG family transcriptional regulator [Thermoanaerobaculia bacterium]
MFRTQIQLTDEQSQELKRLATQRRTSVAELIRQAAEELLRESSIQGQAERKERARAIAGRFRSGKRDLSTEHDEYLAEVYGE